jgi:hypothetical protein
LPILKRYASGPRTDLTAMHAGPTFSSLRQTSQFAFTTLQDSRITTLPAAHLPSRIRCTHTRAGSARAQLHHGLFRRPAFFLQPCAPIAVSTHPSRPHSARRCLFAHITQRPVKLILSAL